MTVADLMRQWRAAAGLSTTEAGNRLGLSARTIEDIEQGRRRAGDALTQIALAKLIADAAGTGSSCQFIAVPDPAYGSMGKNAPAVRFCVKHQSYNCTSELPQSSPSTPY